MIGDNSEVGIPPPSSKVMKTTSALFPLVLCLMVAGPLSASPATQDFPAYRIDMELNPAAPLPFLSKFGKIDLSVYPGGVYGESTLLEGYSRNNSAQLTILSPYSRVYSDVNLTELRQLMLTLSRSDSEVVPGLRELKIGPNPQKGAVRGIPATRYRIVLGNNAWLDVWTTDVVPKNPQFHALQMQFIGAISRAAAQTAARIPGMPVYVELNTRRFQKVPILRLKQIVHSSAGETDALSTGHFYIRSPVLKLLLK